MSPPMLRSYSSDSYLPVVPTLCSNDHLSKETSSRPAIHRYHSHNDAQTQSAGFALDSYLSTYEQPSIRRITSGSTTRGASHEKTDAEADIEAHNLFATFLRCDAFKKYREGIAKKNKRDAMVWPLHTEWAFFRALCRIPPCGRDQKIDPKVLGGKKLGRNERLEQFIWQTTGHVRERKQISSHLQVLRGYVVHEPILLNYLISKKELADWNKTQTRKGLPTGRITDGTVGYCLLEPEAMQFMPILQTRSSALYRWSMQNFNMSLQPQQMLHSDSPIHLYNKMSDASQTSTLQMATQAEVSDLFPELDTQDFSRPIGNCIISVKAEIALPEVLSNMGRTQLAISQWLNGPTVSRTALIDTITTFHSAGKVIDSHQQVRKVDEGDVLVSGYGASAYRVDFGSSTWASLLARLGQKYARRKDEDDSYLMAAIAAGGEGCAIPKDKLPSAKIVKEIKKEVHSLTAVQQITLFSEEDPLTRHNVTLHWRFKLIEHPQNPTVGGQDELSKFEPQLYWSFLELPAVDSALPSPTDAEARLVSRFSTESGFDDSISDNPPTPQFDARRPCPESALKSPIILRSQLPAVHNRDWHTAVNNDPSPKQYHFQEYQPHNRDRLPHVPEADYSTHITPSQTEEPHASAHNYAFANLDDYTHPTGTALYAADSHHAVDPCLDSNELAPHGWQFDHGHQESIETHAGALGEGVVVTNAHHAEPDWLFSKDGTQHYPWLPNVGTAGVYHSSERQQ